MIADRGNLSRLHVPKDSPRIPWFSFSRVDPSLIARTRDDIFLSDHPAVELMSLGNPPPLAEMTAKLPQCALKFRINAPPPLLRRNPGNRDGAAAAPPELLDQTRDAVPADSQIDCHSYQYFLLLTAVMMKEGQATCSNRQGNGLRPGPNTRDTGLGRLRRLNKCTVTLFVACL